MLSALKSTFRNSPLFGQNPIARRWRAFGAERPAQRHVVVFIVAWTFLNLMTNVQYPRTEPPLWYLLPSPDVAVLLGVYALVGLVASFGGKRLSWLQSLCVAWPVHVLVAVLLLGVRVFRLGDGVARVFQSRPGNLFLDAEMVPELARLLHSTLPTWQLALAILGVVLVVPLLLWGAFTASRASARFLAEPKRGVVFWSITGAQLLISPLTPKLQNPDRYLGAFAASVVPEVRGDFAAFLLARQLEGTRHIRLRKARERLDTSSGDLALLDRANVFMFIVESYGVELLENAEMREYLEPEYGAFEKTMKENGYSVASRILDSPTIGGYSWLAHMTLGTGVRIANQGEFKYVYKARPKTMMHYFSEAGYRTVTAEPATQRAFPGKDFYGFRVRFHYDQLNYKGPKFSWSPMPDQYVIDTIHRRVVSRYKAPLFIKYAFGSSHGPWNVQPPVIVDWSQIGDGSIYDEIPKATYPTSWTDLSRATKPYVRSISYTLDVIRRYLGEFIKDDALIIIFGDHQPTGQITNNSRDSGVPFHVISRNPAFIRKFIQRGYVPGLRADPHAPRLGLETFAGDLLEDFSTPR